MVKFSVFFLTLLTALYFLVLGNTAVVLASQENLVAKVMGISLFVLPAVALWGIILELRFGFQSEQLAKQIQAEGKWPVVATETMPSGRPVKSSALALFDGFKQAADANPTSYLAWFNLAMSYDACGDRARARKALRKALVLKKALNTIAQEKTASK